MSVDSRILNAPPNKPLQRSGVDKVLGRGRGDVVLEQVLRARVLKPQWPVAERGCYAPDVSEVAL
jgi:hypothetical protein